MKMKMLIGQILMMKLMSFICLSQCQNLVCSSDYLEVITCVWNTSSLKAITPANNCSLNSIYNDHVTIQTPQSNMEPLGSYLRKGTLNFVDEALHYGELYVPLFVYCGNMTEPVQSQRFYPPRNVKLNPPSRPVVEGGNVTWQHGTPQSTRVRKVKYEIQWDLLENIWEKKQVAFKEEEQCELPENDLILGRQYKVRVRATPLPDAKFWSEWSPVTEWTSTVGSHPREVYTSEIPDLLLNSSIAAVAAVAVVLLVFFYLQRNKRIMKCSYVPTPGNYFGGLFSDHGGDFKSWLGPIVNPEMYIKADSECISPVTIYKAITPDILANKMEKDVKMDGNTSSFSNSTYFLSQNSKSAVVDRLEPCSADCPYGPAGGGSIHEKPLPGTHDNAHDNELSNVNMSAPLETSSSYKQLQKLRLDVQSPDSGFAGSSEEQESQEDSGSEGLPSPPVMDNTLPINCILHCPMPQMIRFPLCDKGIPPGLAWNPRYNQSFTNMPPDISRNILLGNSSTMACSGILEPSSDDYMPVKKVQE